MKYWLYKNNIIEYYKGSNKICRKQKKEDNAIENKNRSQFYDIKENDKVVYFDKRNNIIIGLFQVKTMRHQLPKNDPYFPECDAYDVQIEQPKQEAPSEYLSLKKFLLFHPSFESEFESNRTCKEIDPQLYEEIEGAYSNFKYFKKTINETIGSAGPTGWRLDPDLIAGLLDYYNSRAVSFASLLVASIFGLVTMSAIIAQVSFNPSIQLTDSLTWSLRISAFLYSLFFLAGWYVLSCYSYYTKLADIVKVQGLQTPCFKDLKKIEYDAEEGYTNLIDTIYEQQRKHANSIPKCWLKKTWIFPLIFAGLVILLFLTIYYPIIHIFYW